MAGPVSISTNQVNTLQPPPSADQQLKDIQDHVGSRAVSGKVASWVRNNIGKGTENAHTAAFRAALADKVGSKAEADNIMHDLGLGGDNTRSLTSRKVADGIALADAYVKARQDDTQASNDAVKLAVKNAFSAPLSDADKLKNKTAGDEREKIYAKKEASYNKGAPYKTAKGEKGARPLPNPKLSNSGFALLTATTERLAKVVPQENAEKLANSFINQLGLKDNEAITDKHIDKMNDLATRCENYMSSDLGRTAKPDIAAGTFLRTWEFIHKGDNYGEPRLNLLKDDEIVAISAYSTMDYDFMNREMRTPSPNGGEARIVALIASVNKGLDRLPTVQGTSFRGTNLPENVDAGVQKGNVFSDRAFMSTAASTTSSFPGAHQIAILGSTGRDISFLSVEPQEQEVLFKPNTKFDVLDRQGTVTFDIEGKPNGKNASVKIKLVEIPS